MLFLILINSSFTLGCKYDLSMPYSKPYCRRRIKTEEKAKVVAAVWGTELIQFIAVLAILHQDDFMKGMNSSCF